MADDNEREEEEQPSLNIRKRVWWPGAIFSRLGKIIPRFDPQQSREVFKPVNRLVRWDGAAGAHQTEICAFPKCRVNEQQIGHHEEVRPEGFVWEGVYFQTLADALSNQAFRAWYEDGGQEVVERRQIVTRAPQYREHQEPPLPRYNFFIHEHVGQMTPEEVHAYYSKGEVPTRFRRRGRSKTNSPTLSIGDDEA